MRLKETITVAVIAVIIIGFFFYLTRERPEEVPEEIEEEPLVPVEERDEFIKFWEEIRDECIRNQTEGEFACRASIEKDISICEEAKEITMCKDNYYVFSSILKEDSSECHNIIDETAKILCRAYSEKNSLICDQFIDPNSADTCKIIFQDCNTLAGADKSSCLLLNSLMDKKNYCDKIEDEDAKNTCNALLKKDSSLCIATKVKRCNERFQRTIEALT